MIIDNIKTKLAKPAVKNALRRVLPLLTVVFLLLFCVVISGCIPSDKPDLLSWQAYPIEVSGVLNTPEGFAFGVRIIVSAPGSISVEFTPPGRLSDVVIDISGGECFVHIDKTALPCPPSLMPNITALIDCFSLSDEDFIGVSLGELAGEKLSVAEFSRGSAVVTVWIHPKLPIPIRFEHSGSGISFDVTSRG